MRAAYSSVSHVMTVDGHEISVAPGEAPHLHGYIDGSVIDLIVNKSVGYTKRFYYGGAVAPDIKVNVADQANKKAAVMSIWNIKPISENRLTTPARS